jgi:hypothetical protein
LTIEEIERLLPGWAVGAEPVRDLSSTGGPLLWSAVQVGSRKQIYALSPVDLIRRCLIAEGKMTH